MKEISSINERISLIIENQSDNNQRKFAEKIGFAPQVIYNIVSGRKSKPSFDVLAAVVSSFVDISSEWLLTGEGEMIANPKNKVSIFKPDDLPLRVGKLYRAPIYEAYPVSAGNLGMANMQSDKPNGYAYTTMPGVTFFPVVGCSFEPIIKAGNYIGVVKLDSWDRVDTEKIYFILTREERMIKRLRIDEGDQSALWCVSPNFREFKILKSDILEISHVFFYGMMV